MKHAKHLAMFLLANLAIISLCSSAYDIKNLSGFKCPGITKMNFAIRLNEKNIVECFSINGQECATFSDDNVCRNYIESNISNLKPRQCSVGSKSRWCKEGRKFYFKRWMCHDETGLTTGIRLNTNGQLECISKNGRDCSWGELGNRLCQKVKKCKATRRRIKPLTCGNGHTRVWGHNGYRFAASHWCKKGFAFYFYTGHWLCKRRTGISTPLRLAINGDIECLSKNKRDCLIKFT